MTETSETYESAVTSGGNYSLIWKSMIALVILVALTSFLTMRLVKSNSTFSKWVYDYSATLSRQELETLASMCDELSKKSTAKLAIVILASTDRAPVNIVADSYFKDLGVGTRDLKSGILLLVVVDSGFWQVRTSDDISKIFPTARIKSIMAENAETEFEDNNYGQVIISAAGTIIGILEQEFNQ